MITTAVQWSQLLSGDYSVRWLWPLFSDHASRQVITPIWWLRLLSNSHDSCQVITTSVRLSRLLSDDHDSLCSWIITPVLDSYRAIATPCLVVTIHVLPSLLCPMITTPSVQSRSLFGGHNFCLAIIILSNDHNSYCAITTPVWWSQCLYCHLYSVQ